MKKTRKGVTSGNGSTRQLVLAKQSSKNNALGTTSGVRMPVSVLSNILKVAPLELSVKSSRHKTGSLNCERSRGEAADGEMDDHQSDKECLFSSDEEPLFETNERLSSIMHWDSNSSAKSSRPYNALSFKHR